MIFVTLGSQKFQFNRLLEEIDRLITAGKITEPVFAQIGYSTYEPQHYEYTNFIDKSEFVEKIDASGVIITHGGTGSIINCVKKGKKVIAVPRLAEHGEHVDDHQVEIIEQFQTSRLIYGANVHELAHALEAIKEIEFQQYDSNTENIIKIIDGFLSEIS